MSSSASFAVSMTIGTPDSARMIRQTSMPDSSGSIRSSRTRSGLLGAEPRQRLAAIGGGDDPVALELERLDEGLPERRLVVDDEDRSCHSLGMVRLRR